MKFVKQKFYRWMGNIKKPCAMCLKKVGDNFMIGRYIRTGTFLRISILFFCIGFNNTL